MRRTLLWAGTIAALLAGTNAADAGPVLWGLSSSGPGRLYTIDPATGAASLAATVTGAAFTSLVGLEYYNGQLYATDVFEDRFRFGSIDPATGAFTVINDQDGSANWHGLAADHQAGVFYTIDLNDGNKLKSITPAGVVTTIGAGTGIAGVGMAFDDVSDILYAAAGSSLYRVDTATGVASLVGFTGIFAAQVGLAFDNASGALYLNNGAGGLLYRLSPSTGQATLVGSNGVFGIDGLALAEEVAPVPEPGTLLLLGAGLLALGRRRPRAR